MPCAVCGMSAVVMWLFERAHKACNASKDEFALVN